MAQSWLFWTWFLKAEKLLFTTGKENKFSRYFPSISLSQSQESQIKPRAHHTVPCKRAKWHWDGQRLPAFHASAMVGGETKSGWKTRKRKRILCILQLHNPLCLGTVNIFGGSEAWGAQKLRNSWSVDEIHFYYYKVIFFWHSYLVVCSNCTSTELGNRVPEIWPWGVCISMNFLKCRQYGKPKQIFWGLAECPGHGAGTGGTRLGRSGLSLLPALMLGHTKLWLWQKCKLAFLWDKLGHRGHQLCCPLSVAGNGRLLFVHRELFSPVLEQRHNTAHGARAGPKGNSRLQVRNSTFIIILCPHPCSRHQLPRICLSREIRLLFETTQKVSTTFSF